MDRPFEWHDLCRKGGFSSEKKTESHMNDMEKMMRTTAEQIFQNKMEVRPVSPFRMDYITVLDDTKENGPVGLPNGRGGFILEARYSVWLVKAE